MPRKVGKAPELAAPYGKPAETPGIGHNSSLVDPYAAMAAAANPLASKTADELVARHLFLKDWMAAESKRFAEYLAPHKAEMEAIDNQLHGMLNALGGGDKAMLSSDAGTAYLSTLMNVSVSPDGAPYTKPGAETQTGREALLDFALDNWDEIGNELLLFQAQKDAVRRWMDEHDGQPPPGLKISYFTRVNVRRS